MSKAVLRGYQRRAVKTIAEAFVGDPIHSLPLKTSARSEAASKKGHSYKPLPTRFPHGEFDYRQIHRKGDFAIYQQTWKGNKDSAGFEVVRIRRRERFVICGRSVEAAEIYPTSEAWGVDGWTLSDKNSAFRKLREIIASPNALASFEQKEARRIEKSPT